MEFLEYNDVSAEIKGNMVHGRLKMTDQNIIFKNSKTGKVEQINASDIEIVNFQKLVGSWGLRVFMKNGTLHRYGGFKEGEQEKVAKFFKNNYHKDMLEKELSLKGWNWGTAKFNGAVLSFNVGSNTAFEIPLHYVSQCNTGKNEVTLEFHQNDDTPVSLMEMRFHIPTSELAGDMDAVDAFHQQVMNKASVISVSGDAIAIFRELQCLTPRGRYDIKVFQTFFQLHGKTFDYKIPMSTVLRLFLLPHKDMRQMFFVVSLDPPIKQGQTRYHYLVLLFGNEEETSLELPFTEEELKEKYEGKISKELSGPTYEVLAKIMKVIINRRVTGPGDFLGHHKTPAIACSYKAAAGYLYPLEKGFIYVHKPPVHIRFEEIASVNFARGGASSTKSFDFEIELKTGTIHTFSSIEKGEYDKLFDYITSKKLHVKNTGKNDKALYDDDFGDSDTEKEPDAYLERVKAEAKERDSDDSDGSDESTDEDFNPDKAKESDVAEEYDTNPSSSEDSDASGASGDSKKEKKKEKKPKKTITISEAPRKRKEKSKKREKDVNAPKRAATAFMLWLNENRKKIVEDNPGIKVTEIAKKGGEMWRDLKDKSEWEEKAAKSKEEYNQAMKKYKESGAADEFKQKKKQAEKERKQAEKKTSKPPAKKAAKANTSGSGAGAGSGKFTSKEYIEDDDSSSDDDKKKKDSKDSKDSKKEKEKSKSKSSSSEAEASSGSEEESGSGSD
ncbi:FACT complex subunit Ssrp1 [Pectinophora gossypiella]|uniref:FACT complex subunit SSRP1 n=1 Tax=Pectinophora gossypiella TaxID=13191 RepID=A0A1E1W699_PECGO|nr:FACT complex subunit Ssrp1 [Pectinophora gossypiella]XP_049873156.1 FACT complex subunit Ssrp1 [Pectinophora gossypiella]